MEREVSAIAAKYIDFDSDQLIEAATPVDKQFCEDIRILATSCLFAARTQAGETNMTDEYSGRVVSTAQRVLNHAPMIRATTTTREAFNDLLDDAKVLARSTADGIHPAPAEFSNAQVATDPVLHFFHYAHLPPKLKETSRSFFILAAHIINTVPRNPERTVALRKLLEAKDAAVRANLELPGFAVPKEPLASVHHIGKTWDDLSTDEKNAIGAAADRVREIGEPVEIGDHDEDRDGPIPFGD